MKLKGITTYPGYAVRGCCNICHDAVINNHGEKTGKGHISTYLLKSSLLSDPSGLDDGPNLPFDVTLVEPLDVEPLAGAGNYSN